MQGDDETEMSSQIISPNTEKVILSRVMQVEEGTLRHSHPRDQL